MRGVSRTALAITRERFDEVVAGLDEPALRSLAEELFSVVHLLDAEPRLRRMVSDPAQPAERRAGLLGGLVAGRVSAPTARLVETLAAQAWARPVDLVDAADELAADALFTVAERTDALDDVEDELFRFGRILDREPGLRTALTDPAMPADSKDALLGGLLDSRVNPATSVLVREVVLHPRARTIDRGLDEYGRLAAARRNRLVATVTTVVPLTDEQLTRLAGALSAHVGHRVHLNVEIDPRIVGGIAVRVGDELFDGTIAHRIVEARRAMTR